MLGLPIRKRPSGAGATLGDPVRLKLCSGCHRHGHTTMAFGGLGPSDEHDPVDPVDITPVESARLGGPQTLTPARMPRERAARKTDTELTSSS